MSIDLIQLAAQLERSWDVYLNRKYPNGNVRAELAQFVANSATILQGVATAAAKRAEWASGAAMLQEVAPLTNSLVGITVVSNFVADLSKFAQAIDHNDPQEINRTAEKLVFSVMGAVRGGLSRVSRQAPTGDSPLLDVTRATIPALRRLQQQGSAQ
jgi:hypothetical protein